MSSPSPISDLDVPETLQALAAARLDNLDARERTLLQDAAVLGISFFPAAVAAVERAARGRGPPRRSTRWSPSRSSVARTTSAQASRASTTSSRRCCARSPSARCRGAIARPATSPRPSICVAHTGDATEIAEVLASHYLEAVEADPDAADADDDPRTRARDARRQRASAPSRVALGAEARRYFERAATLARDDARARRAARRGRLGGGTHRGPRRRQDAARAMP